MAKSAVEISQKEMDGVSPYISVVVVARNDDHGGNLRGRMQAFVNGWIAQCDRHRLPAELILVEWNPPVERPRMAEALTWPRDGGYCSVRIIEVPAAIHRRYQHGDALPLYQMIGKNAGIRRARGRFVLATNIDIIFSDELMQFLALGQLDSERMYRIDRHDVMPDVPIGGAEEQLAYCRTHLIRLNCREGTFSLTPDGTRVLNKRDVAPTDSDLLFGEGWFPVEGDSECYRWADTAACIHLGRRGTLMLDLEPGPSLAGEPLTLQILDADLRYLGRAVVQRRSQLRVSIPEDGSFRALTFRVLNTVTPLEHDPRILAFRVYRCVWEQEERLDGQAAEKIVQGPEQDNGGSPVPERSSEPAGLAAAAAAERNGAEATPERMPGRSAAPEAIDEAPRQAARLDGPREETACSLTPEASDEGRGPVANADGPEEERSGSVGREAVNVTVERPAGQEAASAVGDPPAELIAISVEPSPHHAVNSVWARFQSLLRLLAYSETVALVPVCVPPPFKRLLRLYCENGGITALIKGTRRPAEPNATPPSEPQPIPPTPLPPPQAAEEPPPAPVELNPPAGEEMPHEPDDVTLPAAAEMPRAPADGSPSAEGEMPRAPDDTPVPAPQEAVADAIKDSVSDEPTVLSLAASSTEAAPEETVPLLLHTNGCGDFTLMARERWFDLRGYPEFDLYSMHIDSVFCYAAHTAGVREEILREPMRIYHIEHGSGWTPEGQAELFSRLTAKGVSFLEYSGVVAWIYQMRRFKSPMIFNPGNWGLADFDLPETHLAVQPQAPRAEDAST